MIRSFKYRLFSNKREQAALDFILWQQRILYNAALEQRKTVYEETGKGVSYPDQWAHFRDQRRANPDTFGLVNATSLQQLLRRVDKAYKAFFRRLKAGETPGYPRFKGRNRFHSMEFKHGDGVKLYQNESGQVRLRIQNVGAVKVKWHRELPSESQIKHVVIKRNLGHWYVILMVALAAPVPIPPTGEVVGIENLTLGFMTANRHLALSAHDAALGEFRHLLTYKAEEAGKKVVPVPPQYTSQMCSGCGTTVAKHLSMRTHKCDGCGLELDRDVNAARNILALGLSVCDPTPALAVVSQEAPHFQWGE